MLTKLMNNIKKNGTDSRLTPKTCSLEKFPTLCLFFVHCLHLKEHRSKNMQLSNFLVRGYGHFSTRACLSQRINFLAYGIFSSQRNVSFPGATSIFCLISTSNICNCYFTRWTTKYFLENLNIIFTLT